VTGVTSLFYARLALLAALAAAVALLARSALSEAWREIQRRTRRPGP
jgi:hypothetical protein